ncbi:P-loop containing nucleoside triphosphate hydrolase protein [Mycena latifolia]|nr:P-loop containing nucleoside triphosphate hydrolase protein [Mycena latifolia]
MPFQPTPAKIRLNDIIDSLKAALTTLDVVSEGLRAPFLELISNVTRSLLAVVQMLEQIHELLHAIIYVHVTSDTGGKLSPKMIDNLGRFTETLHKIHAFVEAVQEKSKIKQFFRQAIPQIQAVTVFSDMEAMQQNAQTMHQEVLELISALSDGGTSDSRSTISKVFSSSYARYEFGFNTAWLVCDSSKSSNSVSLLPSEPKRFYGRESEVSAIIQAFGQETPRIAILGGGGMGKTSLARAILHHPIISGRYQQHRFFVACDAASTSVQLAALIALHVGLKPAEDLTQPVICHFSENSPCLLILDNLETVWEPMETRGDVEKFLALLTDISHLALIITMRGAERPGNVKWTHPFLPPLKPLAQEAARKAFIEIVDDGYSAKEIDKILSVTDNMPLAIDLIAHLVDYEGLASVMLRWETERTSLLSDGHNKGSNLELLISVLARSPTGKHA